MAVDLSQRKPRYRRQLPRLFELHDLLPYPLPAEAYFQDFEKSLGKTPQKLKQFRDVEDDLQCLDGAAWRSFKEEIRGLKLLERKDPKRGWQAVFDKLNEAKGYRYLKRVGYTDIRFLPRAKRRDEQTPDLEAKRGAEIALCEVKTINVSDAEVERARAGAVSSVAGQLDQMFIRKFNNTITLAKSQLEAHHAAVATKLIAYVVLNFDDLLHEYADRYRMQIESHLESSPVPGVEVILDIKPPFYRAMG